MSERQGSGLFDSVKMEGMRRRRRADLHAPESLRIGNVAHAYTRAGFRIRPGRFGGFAAMAWGQP